MFITPKTFADLTTAAKKVGEWGVKIAKAIYNVQAVKPHEVIAIKNAAMKVSKVAGPIITGVEKVVVLTELSKKAEDAWVWLNGPRENNQATSPPVETEEKLLKLANFFNVQREQLQKQAEHQNAVQIHSNFQFQPNLLLMLEQKKEKDVSEDPTLREAWLTLMKQQREVLLPELEASLIQTKSVLPLQPQHLVKSKL